MAIGANWLLDRSEAVTRTGSTFNRTRVPSSIGMRAQVTGGSGSNHRSASR